MAAVPLFCRHNRFEANCPICSKEKAAQRRPSPGSSSARTRTPGAPAARRHGAGQRGGRIVTKRLARAGDDGYRHDLVPGIKATADAERLAACLAWATARLQFPGPHPELAELGDIEQATWQAFVASLPEAGAATTVDAYRAWADRAGSQQKAITGEPSWTPTRRFARVFDRLALPGFARGQRFEFLNTLGSAGLYEIEADALHLNVAHDDATTLAAKRALNSGDAMLLERRAAALADATGVPVGALDRALALWDSTDPVDAPEHDEIRAALHV